MEMYVITLQVVVADNDGILQVFSVKREDIQLQFKTLPGPKISAVQLGGELGKISVSCCRQLSS